MRPQVHAYGAWARSFLEVCPLRDLFLDGLPILDALEVSGSTAAAARWVNCDQSSISRAYRRVSEQLGIAFNKDDDGYQANDNLHLLASLRHASQLRRLAGGAALLQWISHPEVNLGPVERRRGITPLDCLWRHERRSLDLLQRRVLDLVLVPSPRGIEGVEAITALELAPLGAIWALVLQDLSDHPSIQALIAELVPAGGLG